MDESNKSTCVRVKRKKVKTVFQNVDKIHELFSVRLCEKTAKKQDVSNTGGWVLLEIEIDNAEGKVPHSEIVSKVQSYVDSLCGCERESCEDSSYDSDFEGDEGAAHPDVSRTVSDTLGAEFAEYVSCVSCPSAGYTARVEFGLKLGYSERLVQAALHKLGPAPAQNELLEELIRLGAQAQQRTQGSDVGGVDDTGATAAAANTLSGAAEDEPPPLRPIVIDGSNVAMSHGNKEVFSCRGIKLCVDWFRARGHKDITVFVPKWRKESSRPDNPVTDQEILTELEKDRCLVFTPSRLVGGKRMVCYDDRYILKLASEVDGIVVSNDNYRDLVQESPEFRKVVAERILMYSFVNDRFMPPDDPLGRSGPTLDNFLRLQQRGDPPPPCPYGKKCTYGNKCKFHHPERGPLPHKSVTERLVENAQRQLQARIHSRDSSPGNQLKGASLSLPLPDQDSKPMARKMPLSRTKSTAPVLAPPPTMIADQKSGVSKSRSVENVAGNQQPHPSENVYPTYQPVQAPLPGYGLWNNWGNQFGAKPPQLTEPSKSPPPDNGANLHRKLQRQLTLNPSYDPRLFQLRRGYVQNPHRPLGGRHSNSGVQQCWDHLQPQQHQHQSVTRIASAPDTYRPWPHAAPPPTSSRHMHRLSSTSDPQLNLSDGTPTLLPHNAASNDPFDSSLWMAQNPPPSVVWPPQHLPPPPQYPAASSDDARRRLHYHLAYIFPEEQVQKAMQLYPDETNPQKICAAILAMFPKP